jgi:hypothetical protein
MLIVVQAIISGFLSRDLAKKKGYSPETWFACGFFLGSFGLIAAAELISNKIDEAMKATPKKMWRVK